MAKRDPLETFPSELRDTLQAPTPPAAGQVHTPAAARQPLAAQQVPATIRLPFNVSVLLWNINGPGLAEYRNCVVPRVIKELNPDVVLLQEIETKKILNDLDTYEQVPAGDKKESQILYSKEDFISVEIVPSLVNVLETVIENVVEEPECELDEKWKQKFRNRISIVGLKQRNGCDAAVIVFMSFHNVHAGRESTESFCRIVSEISRRTGYIVIAGADLNYDLLSGKQYGVTICSYIQTDRRSAMFASKSTIPLIDHFIIAPKNVTGISAEALGITYTRTDCDKLHELMMSIKCDLYHKALENGLDEQSEHEAMHQTLKDELDKGHNSTLNEALQTALTDGLAVQVDKAMQTVSEKGLNEPLCEFLKKGLKKVLHKPLADALDKALHVYFDCQLEEALNHDPVLLEPDSESED